MEATTFFAWRKRAASNWHEHFATVSRFDFIPFEGLITVFKRKTKCMYVTIHGNLLVIGSKDDCTWFKAELSRTFTVKCEGPYSVDDKWECQYLKLKRTIVCTEAEIVIEPSEQYIPKLLEPLKVERCRGKSGYLSS